ncbi:MAG: hypothetical protein ACYCZ7_01910 [Minisyncoccota bacterium]
MFRVQEIKTDPDLLKKLAEAASQPMSRDEINAQKVSFIFSMVGHRGVSRSQIQEVLAKQQGV